MKILITGASGFVGKYLTRLLLKHGHKIIAMGINNGCFFEQTNITAYDINILDYPAILECIKKEQPDGIIHLAAISNVPISWQQPAQTIDVNVIGTINVLKALIENNSKTKFLNIGSSDEYGLAAKTGIPLTEDVLCQPQNPYSISKYCAEQMVMQLGIKNGVTVIQMRSFNHFGPGQENGFVTSDFASQIAAIEKGEQNPIIKVGDLDVYRDFLFVTDVVEAYASLMEKDVESGIYNICSGYARKIEEVLNTLVDLSYEDIKIEKDLKKMRAAEVPFFIGNCAKLKKATGWQPHYDFKRGMEEVLNYWRDKR